MKQKGDALNAFKQFKLLVENQLDKKIITLQSDWGGEFHSFTNFLQSEGIMFRQSCPHTFVQNGRVERRHRQLVEVGLTLLAQASMPLSYWWEAFTTATYLVNRLPTTVLEDQSPYFVLLEKLLDYKSLKPFGCACFPNLRPYNNHKFSYHSTRCVFLGYSNQHKGYKCVSSTGRIYISHHVIFNEKDFSFKDGFLNARRNEEYVLTNITNSLSLSDFVVVQDMEHNSPCNVSSNSGVDGSRRTNSDTSHASSSESVSAYRGEQIADSSLNDYAHSPDGRHNEGTSDDQLEIVPDLPQRSTSDNLNQTQNIQPQSIHPMTTRSKSGIVKPNAPYVGNVSVNSNIDNISLITEPTSVEKALQIPHWKEAMMKEIDAITKNNT